jgi:dTDP-4-dehydrorhamnose reductase
LRWVVVGETGLFGSELIELLTSKGEKVVGFNRKNLDILAGGEIVARVIGKADILVNAVGYTNVDEAEDDFEQANNANAKAAGVLASAALILGARFFHISSDYVFDGDAMKPYLSGAPLNPRSAYGRSKALGEKLVSEQGGDYTIFRTAWLYGRNRNCFPKAIAKALIREGAAKVVKDQVGNPTWTRDLAEVLYSHGVNNFDERVVHAVSSGSGSWFDFAREIAKSLPKEREYFLSPISTADYPSKASRPSFSVLDNSESKGPKIGDWTERWKIAAPSVLKEYLLGETS